jgi:hypothetical protein
MNTQPFDWIPLWGFFVSAVVLSTIAVELGRYAGNWRQARGSSENEATVSSIVASVLGLSAFMLAFAFSMAASRFDARRQAVLEEANSIGTTYLRSELLPEPQRSELGELLRNYVALRVQVVDKSKILNVVAQSDELLKKIWSEGVAVSGKDPHSITTGLFLQSLNETIDLNSKRVFVGLYSRVPWAIWLSLWSLTLIGMMSIGYQAGLSGAGYSPAMHVASLAFAVVLLLVVDLDRGQEGMLKVSQQAMIDLLESMQLDSE